MCSVIGHTQDVEYYRYLADTTHDSLLKLVALDSVISKSYLKDDDAFIVFSIQYIALAEKVDSIELAAKKAMNLQSILSSNKNNPIKALTIINGVLANKYKIKDSFLLGGLYLKKGKAHSKIDLPKAIDDYTLALNNFGINDSIHRADTFLFRGQAYSNLGDFVPAAEDFKSAINIYESLKDYEYMQYAQQGNITMYSMNGFYDKAKKERDILINKLIELDLTNYLSVCYYNQAVDYKKTGDYKRYYTYLLKADSVLSLKPKTEDKTHYIVVQSKLAEYYCNEYEIEKAETYFQHLDTYIKNNKDNLMAESYYYGAKAVYYDKIGDSKKALNFAKRKKEKSIKLNHKEEKKESYLLLSNIYYNLGEYKKSLENKNKYYTIKDSIYNLNTTNTLAYYQTLYETEKIKKELIVKNANIRILKKEDKSFNQLLLIIIIAIILFFGLILLYRSKKELKEKKLLQEKFSQDLLQFQEGECIRISKDLHDSIGQRLLIIKNNLIGSENNNDVIKLVEETIKEVRSISRELSPPFQLQELGVTKTIEYTISQIDESTPLFISTELENIDNLFSKEQEVNIYRIIQESLSNIIKHAEAKASKVVIKKLANTIIISIKDNGIGYDFDEKSKDANSLGLKTLLERTKFLGGKMKVQSEKGKGTLIEYIFPI